MFDIHTHITPNMDDGADSQDEALRILNALKSNGVKNIVLTPHYPNRLFGESKSKAEYLEKIEGFISLPEVKDLDIKLYSGAEVYAGSNILKLIENKEIITLNRSCYVLIEFFEAEDFLFIEKTADALINASYIPVIAHIERYECIQNEPQKAKILYDMGCIIQINADSVISRQNRTEFELADWLLSRDLADVIASDTHNLYNRAPDLSAAHTNICLKYSPDTAERIFFTNPDLILNNKKILRRKD